MVGSPGSRMRASDADRDHMVTLLREHLGAGRLTVEEFRERMDRALSARTFGDLAPLLADLPDLRPDHLPAPASRGAVVSARCDTDHISFRLALSAITIVLYLAFGMRFGLWWMAWFAVVVPILLIRRMGNS